MYNLLNPTSNKGNQIKNLEEDIIEVINANPGLKYSKIEKGINKVSGKIYITNHEQEIIDWFSIEIYFNNEYPYVFPCFRELDKKIERIDDNHINEVGIVCVEFDYIKNYIAKRKLRIYDFIEHYVKGYFMWILLKLNGNNDKLIEWEHKENGKIKFYESLFNTTNHENIKNILTIYCDSKKHKRNSICLCGSNLKTKKCHLMAFNILDSTNRELIKKDIELFTQNSL